MTRYEGMEDLLQRVRQQLKVEDSTPQPSQTQQEAVFPTPCEDERYVTALEQALLLLRHVDHVCSLLGEEQVAGLTRQQSDDLSRLLTKGLDRLATCTAGLQRAVGQS